MKPNNNEEVVAALSTTARGPVFVAALDRTEASESVVPMVTSLLAAETRAAEMHLVFVLEHPPTIPLGPVVPSIGQDLRDGRAYLDEVVRAAADTFMGRIVGHLAVGDPATKVLELALDLEADMIVVGTHQKGALARLVLGSVSQKIATRAQCPVLLARPKGYPVVPEIEPPCADCVATRQTSGGEQMWCARHMTHHPLGHVHYETPQRFAVGSMLIRPE